MGRYGPLVEILKQRHNVSNGTNDDEIERCVAAAEQLVDDYCHRTFVQTGDATPRYYRARSRHFCIIEDCPAVELVEIGCDGQTGAFTTLTDVVPRHGTDNTNIIEALEADMDPFPTGRGSWVRVTPTSHWGWDETPDAVVEAVILHAAKLVKRRDSPEGTLGFEGAGVINVKAGLDPDAMALVRNFRRVASMMP